MNRNRLKSEIRLDRIGFGSKASTLEGLPNREGSKPGEIGGGCSGGTFFGRGVTAAGVTGSGLADRSEGSGQ